MRVAILMGRGIEGCGVTRYALEVQDWYQKNGMKCDIYAALDKKWGRNDAQENNIVQFSNAEVRDLAKKLDEEYDIVYYQSLPANKQHSDVYKKLFYDHMVCDVKKPLKISYQNDHKMQSLTRNSMIWETNHHMDGAFTHSFGSPFAKKMAEVNPHVPLLKLSNGFDFLSLKKYWKPIKEQKRRISYFGRFAGFKDPQRIIDMQPFLAKHDIIGEMRGIERSIGSLPVFYNDLSDRVNSYKTNIHEVKKNETIVQTPEKVWIYGPYNRLEGIEELSNSMFGADFYNLEPNAYGDNIEFAMSEIIACGSIPVFDKHWADNCRHVNGTLFSDMKDFAVYSDRSDLQGTVEQLRELADDHDKREKRRKSCFDIAMEHSDSNMVYEMMHKSVMGLKKNAHVDEEYVALKVAEKKQETKTIELF